MFRSRLNFIYTYVVLIDSVEYRQVYLVVYTFDRAFDYTSCSLESCVYLPRIIISTVRNVLEILEASSFW